MKKLLIYISISLTVFFINAQEVGKDTLYFKYNKKYINIYSEAPGQYYLADSGYDGTFFFMKKASLYDLKPDKVHNLRKFVRKSKFYNKKRHRKLNDYRLSQYFKDYIIFLIKGNEFIKVISGHEVE